MPDASAVTRLVDLGLESFMVASSLNGVVSMRLVRMLLKRGADATVRLREGGTLLHFAARTLRKDLALALLRAGCDPNATDDEVLRTLAVVRSPA